MRVLLLYPAFPPSFWSFAGVTVVPEPASLSVTVLLTAALLLRRQCPRQIKSGPARGRSAVSRNLHVLNWIPVDNYNRFSFEPEITVKSAQIALLFARHGKKKQEKGRAFGQVGRLGVEGLRRNTHSPHRWRAGITANGCTGASAPSGRRTTLLKLMTRRQICSTVSPQS